MIHKRIASILLFCTFFYGCKSYVRVGESAIKAIYVSPVVNSAQIAKISEPLTQSIIREIQEKTAIKLVGADRDSYRLNVEVEKFTQQASVDDPLDSENTLAFGQRLDVIFSLIDPEGHVVIDRQKVSATLDIESQVDFRISSDQNRVALSEIVARKIVAIVAHIW